MFTFGFYNSYNGDRKYDSEQLSSIFDGIIEDGVFANVGEHFEVIPGNGMQVVVKTGRAWFKHTWNLNDTWMTLNLEPSDILRSRIDSVVLEVNSNLEVRENSIKIVKGDISTSPSAPVMIHADGVDQYRLANITINPGVSSVEALYIDNKVGTSETPYVVAPIKSIDVSSLFSEWNREFQEWFANIKEQLAGDVAANLQRQIDDRVKISDKATPEDIANGTPNKWIDAENAKTSMAPFELGDIIQSTREIFNDTLIPCDQQLLSIDEYEKLCTMPGIDSRIVPFANRNGDIIANPVQPSITGDIFCDGYIHDGYIWSKNGKYLTANVWKKTSTETNKTYTIPYDTGTTTYNYSIFYWTTDYIYVIPRVYDHMNKWFVINKETGDAVTYTDSKKFSVPCYIHGYAQLDDGKICFFGLSLTNMNTINPGSNSCKMMVMIYSSDLGTRNIYEYDYKNYLPYLSWLGTCAADAYNYKLFNVTKENKIIYPVVGTSDSSGKQSLKNGGTISFIEFNINNGNFIRTGLDLAERLPNDVRGLLQLPIVIVHDNYIYVYLRYSTGSGSTYASFLIYDLAYSYINRMDITLQYTLKMTYNTNMANLYNAYFSDNGDLYWLTNSGHLVCWHFSNTVNMDIIYNDVPIIESLIVDKRKHTDKISDNIDFIGIIKYEYKSIAGYNDSFRFYYKDMYAEEKNNYVFESAYDHSSGTSQLLYVYRLIAKINNIIKPLNIYINSETKPISSSSNVADMFNSYPTSIFINDYGIYLLYGSSGNTVSYSDITYRVAPYIPNGYIKAKELPT